MLMCNKEYARTLISTFDQEDYEALVVFTSKHEAEQIRAVDYPDYEVVEVTIN